MNDFKQFLQRLRELETSDPREFELQSIQLFHQLVCNNMKLYHEPTFQFGSRSIRSDAAVGKERGERPLFILEAKQYHNSNSPLESRTWHDQLMAYVKASKAKYGIFLSNNLFSILGGDTEISIHLQNMDEQNIEKAYDIINSAKINNTEKQNSQKQISGNVVSQYYSINIDELHEAINRLDEVESAHEKGEAFEDLAGLLFGGIEFLSVRNKRLDTNTSEIDLVVEYGGHNEKTIFDEYSRFILVECKNWSNTVGVPQIRNFKGKMDKSHTDFGIIFAREGITGDEGADAIRWIHDYFQRERNIIIVIDDNEISRMQSGESFYDILDDLLYQRRFDLPI